MTASTSKSEPAPPDSSPFRFRRTIRTRLTLTCTLLMLAFAAAVVVTIYVFMRYAPTSDFKGTNGRIATGPNSVNGVSAASRSRGLGLALASTIAAAHGTVLTLAANADGGLTAGIVLPVDEVPAINGTSRDPFLG